MNKTDTVDIREVINEKDTKKRNEMYNKYVSATTPVHPWYKNMWRAFLVGGLICTLGQGLNSLFMYFGSPETTAGMYTILSLILLSAVLTGAGAYTKIAKYAGAGILVPITGFANSVASPAIEFKKEGQVYGIGCKIFTIAGPVILYGVVTSFVLGLIHWVVKIMGVV